MLDLLSERPRTTEELCSHFQQIDRCTVMQHLGVLEKAKLVIVKREGRQRWNYLNVMPLQEIYDRWISRYAAAFCGLLMKWKRNLDT